MGKSKMAVLIGRIFFSAIFILSSFNHFTNPQMVTYAAAAGVPFAGFLVPFSGLLALLGGLSILLGYKAQWGAWLIVLFLVPVTLTMHRFWGLTDPQATMMQMVMFEKNLSMLGGALLIAHFGSGPYSVKH
jgi:putative oxidoreductase